MHLCNRVDRRSKSQNISELAFSLNRYHNSATPLFYSETQSDISFLIIRCKDSARREEDKMQSCKIRIFHPEPQPILFKVVQGERESPASHALLFLGQAHMGKK